MGKEVDCQIGGVGKNRKLVTSNLGQGLTAKLQEGHSGLRLAVSIESKKKKNILQKAKVKKKCQ